MKINTVFINGETEGDEKKKDSLWITEQFRDETEPRLEFQTAVGLCGNALLQETVDISVVAFTWRIHAAGKKRTSFGWNNCFLCFYFRIKLGNFLVITDNQLWLEITTCLNTQGEVKWKQTWHVGFSSGL